MSPLLEAQVAFFKLVPRLIDFAVGAGYVATGGELQRSPQQAKLNAAAGVGIQHSLHIQSLALDVKLYDADGRYCDGTTAEDVAKYRDLGRFWTSLDPRCCWGGDFVKPDLDHYSYTFGDVR